MNYPCARNIELQDVRLLPGKPEPADAHINLGIVDKQSGAAIVTFDLNFTETLPFMNKQYAKVKWFDEITGHGLITTDKNKELVIHSSQIVPSTDKGLSSGQVVVFQSTSESALIAKNVEIYSASRGPL